MVWHFCKMKYITSLAKKFYSEEFVMSRNAAISIKFFNLFKLKVKILLWIYSYMAHAYIKFQMKGILFAWGFIKDKILKVVNNLNVHPLENSWIILRYFWKYSANHLKRMIKVPGDLQWKIFLVQVIWPLYPKHPRWPWMYLYTPHKLLKRYTVNLLAAFCSRGWDQTIVLHALLQWTNVMIWISILLVC